MPKDLLPRELVEQIASLMQHAVRVDRDAPLKISVYCNVCEHEIERYGNDWRCVEKPPCRCMMMGCVPKVWDQ